MKYHHISHSQTNNIDFSDRHSKYHNYPSLSLDLIINAQVLILDNIVAHSYIKLDFKYY